MIFNLMILVCPSPVPDPDDFSDGFQPDCLGLSITSSLAARETSKNEVGAQTVFVATKRVDCII
jgi:hypothetical protein